MDIIKKESIQEEDKHYYIIDKTIPRGFREVSQEEYDTFIAHRKEVRAYAAQVNDGAITIDDVPETHREEVELKLAPTEKEKARAYDVLMGAVE